MPFLDHLEELRVRILKSAGALVVGMALGLWMVSRFQLIVLLKKPIEPYLPTGKLIVLGPTEPVMIVLKLGVYRRAGPSSPSSSTRSGLFSRPRSTPGNERR